MEANQMTASCGRSLAVKTSAAAAAAVQPIQRHEPSAYRSQAFSACSARLARWKAVVEKPANSSSAAVSHSDVARQR